MSESDLNTSEALHLEREWMRVTLASIGEAVITTDTQGDVTFLNPVAESLTGWTRESAAGLPLETVFKIVHEKSRRPVENPAVRALREGVVVGLANHTLLIGKDGSERPIDDRAAPIRDAQGEIAGVVLIFRDVTERRRQESLCEDALAYADDIIATLREPFLVLDKSLKVVTANQSFYQRFRVAPEETQGRSIYALGDRQWDIPKLRELLGKVLPHDQRFEVFAVDHDFPAIGRKTVLLNGRRIRKPTDALSELILLSIEDITERRAAEAALIDSEVRYRRLFEAAKDGILILDAQTGRITDANPFMSELLDYAHEDFLGKELWEIGLFSDRSENEAAVRELQKTGYVRYEDLPLETKNKQRVDVEVVANVYQENRQRVIQCNIRDITDRSRMEKKLHEQTVALADLHRRKDEFLAMLSHELRSPLAPIYNAVQLLRLGGKEDPVQHEARSVIERQVGQLTHLVNDLLEVSRITTGRIHLHRERIVFNGIVENGIETVRTLIDQRRHTLEVSLSPSPLWLYADAARLQQVVINLLTNAAKYTDEGGHISISVRKEEHDAVLRIRDSGVGIAPSLLPRIFDLFTQAERSLDRAQGGLGIGLSLVKQLVVDLHGGKVEVLSALGQGSEFVVRLPLLSPHLLQAAPAAQVAAPPSTPPMRILVVDDNVDTAQTLGMLLKTLKHDVRVAHDGPAALEVALRFLPDVVLSDLGLPGLNGYEVAQRLRQEPTVSGVVLIAMTGYGDETHLGRSRDAGFDHHLVKPANFVRLQEILATVKKTGS